MRFLVVLTDLILVLLLCTACSKRTLEVALLETDAGVIVVGFFDDIAPEHVKNFKVLSRSGFYDGTYFQRIVPGEFIQGGDPNTRDDDPSNDGTGGPGYTLKAEFSDISHRRGIVSMARGKSPDSSGSQFFICIRELPRFDGLFTVFGKVIEGMEVVDKIGSLPVDSTGTPRERIHLKKVVIEKRPTR